MAAPERAHPRSRLRRHGEYILARGLARRPAALPRDFPPTVSFTFDDFPESAAENGLPILDAAGMRATWYVASGLLGQPSPVGPIASMDRVAALHAAGHEIGDHTRDHLDAWTVSPETFSRDMAANCEILAGAVPGLRPVSFAYPYGRLTLGTKRAVRAAAASCRSTVAGIGRGRVDLAMLPANPLYAGPEACASAAALIADVARGGGWLIFYTHDVAARPSPWGCTPPAFEAAVAAVRDAGLRVATVGAVVAEIGRGAP